eukprot:scaffold3586_cov164-Amphora_coffeaeformis.AAC.2
MCHLSEPHHIPNTIVDRQQTLEQAFETRLDEMEYSVQSGKAMYEGSEWRKKMVQIQQEMAKKLHPLHWLHVKGYCVMSSCAVSFALFELQSNRKSPRDKPYLYCSTAAQLLHAYWVQQVSTVFCGDVPLKDAVQDLRLEPISDNPSLEDLQGLVKKLQVGIHLARYPDSDVAHSIFHAGQDWSDAQQDQLTDGNEDRIAGLVQSQGIQNPLSNHLLDTRI